MSGADFLKRSRVFAKKAKAPNYMQNNICRFAKICKPTRTDFKCSRNAPEDKIDSEFRVFLQASLSMQELVRVRNASGGSSILVKEDQATGLDAFLLRISSAPFQVSLEFCQPHRKQVNVRN